MRIVKLAVFPVSCVITLAANALTVEDARASLLSGNYDRLEKNFVALHRRATQALDNQVEHRTAYTVFSVTDPRMHEAVR